ncbi:hypothetical protein P4U43_06155 [Arthrobacter sp. EH-1B-1]|uniref:Uncharacterized protein n=1 Tax=Arthrobacter vasquezii TaxID=2977629 RepID=A0ABT6CTI1_9MICC|nr:hypothetical protein [Arthrobacter vasquezii]MDF9277375.1 hypothetical protein [Arthrobacter vasquezii]
MANMVARNRITHLFDCAGVGAVLVKEAKRQHLSWRQIQGPWMRRGTRWARYRFFGELVANYPRTNLWHVHMGGRAKWARGRVERPYVLTLHGTDIRETYWQDEYHEAIKRDIDAAQHVFYATPDLEEKAKRARVDAEYMPIALDFDLLSSWTPAAKPRVFFPSRWDRTKGGDGQIRVAKEVVAAVGDRADVVGIDWGDRAADASHVGVQLVPRMDVTGFLCEMAKAHVAVGQTAGILATSELQAMAMGIPLVFPDPFDGYLSKKDRGALIVDRADAGYAVLELLRDPPSASAKLGGKEYVSRHHDPARMVQRLSEVYREVLSGRTEQAVEG